MELIKAKRMVQKKIKIKNTSVRFQLDVNYFFPVFEVSYSSENLLIQYPATAIKMS